MTISPEAEGSAKSGALCPTESAVDSVMGEGGTGILGLGVAIGRGVEVEAGVATLTTIGRAAASHLYPATMRPHTPIIKMGARTLLVSIICHAYPAHPGLGLAK